jgi:hypothetical protein
MKHSGRVSLVLRYRNRQHGNERLNKDGLACNHRVVTLIRLERHLFDRLEVAFAQSLNFRRENFRGWGGRVDTVGLDRDDHMATVFEEVFSIEGHDTGLVGLSDIGEDGVDAREEHAVFLWCTSVFHDSCASISRECQ